MTVTLEKLGGDTRNSFIEKLKESLRCVRGREPRHA